MRVGLALDLEALGSRGQSAAQCPSRWHLWQAVLGDLSRFGHSLAQCPACLQIRHLSRALSLKDSGFAIGLLWRAASIWACLVSFSLFYLPNGWMASLIRWIWIWASSGGGDGQGSLECCSPRGCRVRHDWTTELNRTWALYRTPNKWKRTPEARLKEPEKFNGRPLNAGPAHTLILFSNPTLGPLNHCCKTSHQILPGQDTHFFKALAVCPPWPGKATELFFSTSPKICLWDSGRYWCREAQFSASRLPRALNFFRSPIPCTQGIIGYIPTGSHNRTHSFYFWILSVVTLPDASKPMRSWR